MIKLTQTSDNKCYNSACGIVMQRERGTTPNGNDFNDKWVLRSADGTLIDYDQYRSDLAERHDLSLENLTVY